MSKFRYYADSIAGVKTMLKEQSNHAVKWIEEAEILPDSWVRGCWLVTFGNGMRLIAYVADHRDAPDFEDID